MKLAELFPTLTAAALRLRHEGDTKLAEGLETLVLRLGDHAESDVEDIPFKAAKGKSGAGSRRLKPPADDEAALQAKLDQLLATADDPKLSLDTIRAQITAVCAGTSLAGLRRAGKSFLHLPMSNKNKSEIEDLLYGHIARRKERTSW